MRVPSGQRRSDISENMMTSMIDVVFQLLIFFVCAAALQSREDLLPTPLAPGGVAVAVNVDRLKPAEPLVPVDDVWVSLSQLDGRLKVRLNGTDFDDLPALQTTLHELAKASPESPIILDIAEEVPAGDMVTVYDTCRLAGFHSINFYARSLRKAR